MELNNIVKILEIIIVLLKIFFIDINSELDVLT